MQGQLTNDIESITDNYLNTSYCTHQGKVIVNMQVILIDNDVVLLLSKSLAEYFIEKISKYILMSDVQFTMYDHINIYWALGERANYMLTKYDIKKTESNNKINKSEYLINMSTKNSYKCRYISLDAKVCENINFASLEQSQTCLLDLLSIVLVVATQAKGSILIHQKMFESRLFFVDKLIDMGAKIILCDPHRATVIGHDFKSKLKSTTMTSPDIRAGISLLIAALSAKGTSIIHNIEQIDRGYEDIDMRLSNIGAKIERFTN